MKSFTLLMNEAKMATKSTAVVQSMELGDTELWASTVRRDDIGGCVDGGGCHRSRGSFQA